MIWLRLVFSVFTPSRNIGALRCRDDAPLPCVILNESLRSEGSRAHSDVRDSMPRMRKRLIVAGCARIAVSHQQHRGGSGNHAPRNAREILHSVGPPFRMTQGKDDTADRRS